jgi:dihydrodipicolinate synthase/N-acetylneuraminate lyase
MAEFQGVFAAAVTPRGKQGDVDFGAAFELIDFLCRAGVQGIALFGAAGEYPALAADERSRLLYLAAKRSRVPVLAGLGSASLDTSVALAREARNTGAAGLVLPPPYFFRYGQDDLREFYLQFSAQAGSGIPVLLANTPAFTSEIAAETALELLETRRFAGIEDASGAPEYQARLDGFPVLAGRDAIFARARCAGARGAISSAACAVPELMLALDRALAAGNREKAGRLDGLLQEFAAWMDRFPEPVLVKAAAGLRGLKTGAPAVPLGPGKQRDMERFREWFPGWLAGVKRFL